VQAKGRCGLGDSQQFLTHFSLSNAFTPRCATTEAASFAAKIFANTRMRPPGGGDSRTLAVGEQFIFRRGMVKYLHFLRSIYKHQNLQSEAIELVMKC
jgi:hypothetical protein